MKATVFVATAIAGLGATSDARADGDPTRGAQHYRACVACHALEPELHLSGPSLGNVFERKAGTAEGFVRYSDGLKTADFIWNAAALDGWLKDPAAMIPGTYMVFQGIADPKRAPISLRFLRSWESRVVERKLRPTASRSGKLRAIAGWMRRKTPFS